jgi:hypothetical protein
MPHFECGAFNHSATSPGRTAGQRPGRYVAASGSPDKGGVETGRDLAVVEVPAAREPAALSMILSENRCPLFGIMQV